MHKVRYRRLKKEMTTRLEASTKFMHACLEIRIATAEDTTLSYMCFTSAKTFTTRNFVNTTSKHSFFVSAWTNREDNLADLNLLMRRGHVHPNLANMSV